jgi:hypothetical protein
MSRLDAPVTGSFRLLASVSRAERQTSRREERQVPERELHALTLAGPNQEARISGANRV